MACSVGHTSNFNQIAFPLVMHHQKTVATRNGLSRIGGVGDVSMQQLLDAVEAKALAEHAASSAEQQRAFAAVVYPHGQKRAIAAIQGKCGPVYCAYCCPDCC